MLDFHPCAFFSDTKKIDCCAFLTCASSINQIQIMQIVYQSEQFLDCAYLQLCFVWISDTTFSLHLTVDRLCSFTESLLYIKVHCLICSYNQVETKF